MISIQVASIALLTSLPSAPFAFAQGVSGTVEGRVQSATTGTYLNNARVRIAGTGREVFTNSFGEYRIADLPSGQATLEVFFTGMAAQRVAVTVPSSGSDQQDVALRNLGDTTKPDGTVVMSRYVVQKPLPDPIPLKIQFPVGQHRTVLPII